MLDYQLISIAKTSSPEGCGNNWHEYIIANSTTSITGIRRGSENEVESYARSCVERLNSRFERTPNIRP